MPTINKFQDLEIWKDAQNLGLMVFQIAGNEKIAKDFSIQDQFRKTAMSISSYIAEGFSYASKVDFIGNLRHSRASVAQLQNLAHLFARIGYISTAEKDQVEKACEDLNKKISGTIEFIGKEN